MNIARNASMTNAIRKAAILISSLDMREADALLEQMAPEQAGRVRNAMMNLGEISPAEQKRVIADFLRGDIGKPPANRGDQADDGGVEIDASLVERLDQEPAPSGQKAAQPKSAALQPPFHFLHDAEPALIAEALRREQPQTIAVVIAHLPPQRAAGVLERLPAALSTEALARMAWLGELDNEVLRELEQQLQAAILPLLQSANRKPAGLSGVNAVLSAQSGPKRQETLRSLAVRDERLSRQLGYLSQTNEPHSAPSGMSAEPAAQVESFRYRAAEKPVMTVDFDDFAALSDADLKQVFAAVDPQIAMLALTGADERLTRRILRQLPTRQAELLRKKLNHPGPIRLRDLEAAQQQVARIASRLATDGFIHSPPQRRFAAAA